MDYIRAKATVKKQKSLRASQTVSLSCLGLKILWPSIGPANAYYELEFPALSLSNCNILI